jgi:hypothetical protein
MSGATALVLLLALRPMAPLRWDPVPNAWRYHVLVCPSNACAVRYVTNEDGAQWPMAADLSQWILVGDLPASKTSFQAFCGYSYIVRAVEKGRALKPPSPIVGCSL